MRDGSAMHRSTGDGFRQNVLRSYFEYVLELYFWEENVQFYSEKGKPISLPLCSGRRGVVCDATGLVFHISISTSNGFLGGTVSNPLDGAC